MSLATIWWDNWESHVWHVLETFVLGYLLTLILIRWVLLTPNRAAASTTAWILTIILLPFVGGLLFAVFGINRVERRAARKQAARKAVGKSHLSLEHHELKTIDPEDEAIERLRALTTRVAGNQPTRGNEVEILCDTNRTLGLIKQAVLAARETLHFEYYIWQPDRTGRNLRDLLIQRAREGVKVRFLYDGLGSMWLGRKFLKPMREAGIQIATFLPGQTFREKWSINLRNHRKIVIADGEVGFTGGMNIGNEYLGKNPELGYWRDSHLRLRGPAVKQLQQVFVEDWYYATGEVLKDQDCFPPTEAKGDVIAQVIASEPAGDTHAFLAVFFAAINEARERIILATSYFVPPDPLVTALQNAALRGVEVKLLVAGRSAHSSTVLAGRSYYETLMSAGVQIYEYQQGLLHSKTLTIDGCWSLVGSANFDNRSLILNFEAGVALYDEGLARTLEEQFESDLARSKRVDPVEWEKRPARRIIVENAWRLFAPVL